MAYALKKRGSTWYVRFTNRDGTRVYQSTKESRKDLAEREAERIYLRSRADSPADTTLAAAAEGMLAGLRRKGRSEETIAFYVKKLRHLARVFDRLSGVTAAAVDDYIAMREGEGASAHSVAKELIALRLVLRHARRRGEYGADPSAVLPSVSSGYTPKERYLTPDEAERLYAAVLNPGAKRYVAFVFATTARHSEVLRATGADYVIEGIRIHGTKTAKAERIVPVLPMLAHWSGRAYTTGPIAEGCGSIRHALRHAARRAGLDPVSPNDLRRSVAHWLRAEGWRLEYVAAFMGHATTRMVETVYGRMGAGELAPNLYTNGGYSMDRVDTADGKNVPRDGIEPPTRGFSSPVAGANSSKDVGRGAHDAPILSYLALRAAELHARHARSLAVLDLFDAARSASLRGDQAACHESLAALADLVRP